MNYTAAAALRPPWALPFRARQPMLRLIDRAGPLKDASVALLYVSSKGSRGSGWVSAELSAVASKGKLIVPLVIDDAGEVDLPPMLRNYQWVDFRASYEEGLAQLLAAFPESVKSGHALEAVHAVVQGSPHSGSLIQESSVRGHMLWN